MTEHEKAYDRKAPAVRKSEILAAALALASKNGYRNITRASIAEKAGASEALVSRYMGSMDKLREAVMREACKKGVIPVIAQGIAERHRAALRVSDDLRTQALAHISRL